MTETFQISLEQAQAYEDYFVPAVFAQWVPTLLDCAELRPGQRILDVACGTGVVARAAAVLAGDAGLVTGLDLNPAMLEVARRVQPDVDWRQGDALDLPFGDEEFDVVLCQSALMFFADRAGALRQMARVVPEGGTVAVQTYAPVGQQPGYGPFVETVVNRAGEEARGLLDLYWSAGDSAQLQSMFEEIGLPVVETRSRLGVALFPSVDALVQTEIRGTPLSERVSDSVLEDIVADCREVLRDYVTPAGALEMPIRAVFLAGRKR